MDSGKQKVFKTINILEIVLIFIGVISLVNIITLTVGMFYPWVSVISGIVITFIILIFFGSRVTLKDGRFNLFFVLILLIALGLRLTPNLYITGGQDQGTYVSLSKQYEINHGLYIRDELRTNLSEEAKNIYDISESGDMIGVTELDLENSMYYMPFYPVFPSWMSIFGSMLGSDNRIYALTMFSILSVIGMYLLAYEISGRKKNIALLASFLLAINPLHVYFSRIPLTEIVSLCFFFFSFYFLLKFYNDYKNGKGNKLDIVLSLLIANGLFYTRMSALLYLPIIVIVLLLSLIWIKDKVLKRYLTIYSSLWIISLVLSYLFYYFFISDLFQSIINGRILTLFNANTAYLVAILLLVLLSFFFIIRHEYSSKLKEIVIHLHKYLFAFALTIFAGLILYEVYLYIKEIFIVNNYSLFSAESLSYLKQLNSLATFLYISPIGFVLIPISFYYFRKEENVPIVILILSILGYLIYCWGMLGLTKYYYYFVRYQLSELIPLCVILVSLFLCSVYKKKYGKVLVYSVVTFCTIYFGFFSVIQLRSFEGADRTKFEEIKRTVDSNDLLLIAGNDFGSSQQIVFPIKYYYDINSFLIHTSSLIDNQAIKDLRDVYDNVYILTTNPDFAQKGIRLVKEIDFKHNYFVHCRRNEDEYFKMEDHSPDIPFCQYIVIPNRYYYGVYKMYLYSWE